MKRETLDDRSGAEVHHLNHKPGVPRAQGDGRSAQNRVVSFDACF